MVRGHARAIELNEAGWWANWGRLRWIGEYCYVLDSEGFEEPFFNRIGLLTCHGAASAVGRAEDSLRRQRRLPHMMVREACGRTRTLLRKRGYVEVDGMNVMRLKTPSAEAEPGVRVRRARPQDAPEWCDAYLLAFYGDLELRPAALRIIRRLIRDSRTTFLVAELDSSVAGVTALYRSPGLLGLYCLGTIPECRGRGVARTILAAAEKLAASERRDLVLQSLASEETEPFYVRFGFEKLYVKRFLRLGPGTPSGDVRLIGHEEVTAIKRDPGVGPHLFTGVFQGFEKVGAVKGIFGEETQKILSELAVDVVNENGYMHINTARGSIVVSAKYLREGEEKYLYLDAIHELVHIRQHLEGKELWDRKYKYVDRPTELEAYQVAIAEARRIGLGEEGLVDYLKVEWVNEEDFRRFLVTLGIRKPKA